MQKVEALFHFLEAGGIDLDAIGVAREIGLEIAQCADGALVGLRERRGGGVDAVDFLEEAADGAELGEEGVVVFAEEVDGALGELEEAGAVAGAVEFLFEGDFFVGVELGGGDLGGLVAEEFELLGVGAVVDDEAGFFGGEGGAAAAELAEVFALGEQAAEGVENGELAGGVEQGLVVVGAVHIDEPLADGAEERKGGGGAVDELAVGSGGGEGAFEDELGVFARFDAVFFEEGGEFGADGGEIEHGLDGATVGTAADELAVGAFAEDEVEGADDDGFARAGFAGDGVVAGRQLEGQVGDQGEVFDSQGGEHGK